MKILTANFVTCAVKACKTSPASFPLHFRDAELEQADMEFNPAFLRGVLPRIEWDALRVTAAELGFTTLPESKPELPTLPTDPTENPDPSNTSPDMNTEAPEPMGDAQPSAEEQDKMFRDLHRLLMETSVVEGKLVCGNCGHEYRIKEGIANFLLPNHLV